MIMKSLAIAGLALSMGAGTVFAGPQGCPPGHFKKGECGQTQQRLDGRGDHDRRDHDRADSDRGHDHGRHHDWKRGERIGPSRYVVLYRYRDYGYQPPPRGHHYVQVDGDVLLIAIASGIIADILLHN